MASPPFSLSALENGADSLLTIHARPPWKTSQMWGNPSTLGQVLGQIFFSPDVAFRLSGDEFALLVWGTAQRLDELTTRLSHGLRTAAWPGSLAPICLQWGVAQPPPGAGLKEWLSLPGARMYRAKRQRTVENVAHGGLDFGHGQT